MLKKLRRRKPSPPMAVALLSLFVALGGTATATHLAVNGSDVVDESLTGADIKGKAATATTPAVPGTLLGADVKDASLTWHDLAPSTLGSSRVLDNALTGADINESTLTGLVQGRGEVLTNRLILVPQGADQASVPLLTIPGVGVLEARCFSEQSIVIFANTSSGSVDLWSDFTPVGGQVLPAGQARTVSQTATGDHVQRGAITTMSLGVGDNGGPRRVATLHVFALQEQTNFPCGFQAQGTMWTSP